jgi:hypothetical protein
MSAARFAGHGCSHLLRLGGAEGHGRLAIKRHEHGGHLQLGGNGGELRSGCLLQTLRHRPSQGGELGAQHQPARGVAVHESALFERLHEAISHRSVDAQLSAQVGNAERRIRCSNELERGEPTRQGLRTAVAFVGDHPFALICLLLSLALIPERG